MRVGVGCCCRVVRLWPPGIDGKVPAQVWLEIRAYLGLGSTGDWSVKRLKIASMTGSERFGSISMIFRRLASQGVEFGSSAL